MQGNLNIKEKKGSKEAKFILADANLSWEIKGKKVDELELEKGYTGFEKLSDTSFAIGPTIDGDYVEVTGSKEEIEKWVTALTPLVTDEKKEAEFHNIDESTKEGWINHTKDKKTMNRYCELFEGSFRIFTSPEKGAKTFKSELYLHDCTISNTGKQITIKPSDKNKDAKPVELTTHLNTEAELWVKAFKHEMEIANKLGPQTGEKKKTGFGARMKKGLGQKLASSKGAKKILNKEATDLLAALNKVITAFSGQKKADEIEKSLIRILTKMYFAISNKQVEYEEFLKADRPLREAFKIVSLIWGGRLKRAQKGVDPKQVIQEAFQNVQKYWKEVENVIVKNLSAIVKPKNLQLIRETLTYLRDPEFIKYVAKNEELEESRLELEMAMDSYTAIELSVSFD